MHYAYSGIVCFAFPGPYFTCKGVTYDMYICVFRYCAPLSLAGKVYGTIYICSHIALRNTRVSPKHDTQEQSTQGTHTGIELDTLIGASYRPFLFFARGGTRVWRRAITAADMCVWCDTIPTTEKRRDMDNHGLLVGQRPEHAFRHSSSFTMAKR